MWSPPHVGKYILDPQMGMPQSAKKDIKTGRRHLGRLTAPANRGEGFDPNGFRP